MRTKLFDARPVVSGEPVVRRWLEQESSLSSLHPLQWEIINFGMVILFTLGSL